MKYVIDSEFIDTPRCSALISLAILREDGEYRYFEFDFPKRELTPWLKKNVVPHLTGERTTFMLAAVDVMILVGLDEHPKFWSYFGAYDWYWFCRLFGGLMSLPKGWPQRYREFADLQDGVPPVAGAEHHALNDCQSILAAMKRQGL